MFAALRSFLTQDIDLRAIGVGFAERVARLTSGSREDFVVIETDGTSPSLVRWHTEKGEQTHVWDERSGDELRRLSRERLVLLLVPEADVISAELRPQPQVKASPKDLVALNFNALSPFPLDAVYMLCRPGDRNDRGIHVDYVPKARIEPQTKALGDLGLACDGLLLGDIEGTPLLIDRRARLRKRIIANAHYIALVTLLFTGGLVLSAALGRLEASIASAERLLSERVAELRKLSPPGNRLLLERVSLNLVSNERTSRAAVVATSLLETEDALTELVFDGSILHLESSPETLERLLRRMEARNDLEITTLGQGARTNRSLNLRPRAVQP